MKTVKNFIAIASVFALVVVISCMNNPVSMNNENSDMGYSIPAGMAWADGKEIRFTHTEVSDPDLAILLTDMMKSPVLLVPSLAQIPDSLLADVYVFANGLKGSGPLMYQADVFDKPAGKTGYTPLRRLHVVSWTDTTKATLLKSVTEIIAVKTNGQVTIEKKPVVINMPFVVWSDGQR